MYRAYVVLCVAMAAALSGCATPKIEASSTDLGPGVHAMNQAAFREARLKTAEMVASQTPTNLAGARFNVIWTGEAAEILSRIAAARNLKFRVTGPQPRLQIPVFLNLINVTLDEALREIGSQCGQRAEVAELDDAIELQMRLY